MMTERPFTILCIATEPKGFPFIHECKQQGCRVLVLMPEEKQKETWPWESIDQHFAMPNVSQQPDVTYAVSYLMRGQKIDRIVALDDYDVATAASLREHLRIPGMGETTARHFRDKLAMRVQARDEGMLVPPFTAVFNYDDLRAYMTAVPAPWVLKPRFEAGAVGIRKLHDSEQVWRTLDELGDRQSFYLLEKFVPGDVYHVDAIIWAKDIVFAIASKYGLPPLAVSHGGGIFTTRALPWDGEEAITLRGLTSELMRKLGLMRGVSHTEFIRGHEDGRFYFLETAARVGGANIDRMVQAATGVELWQEAARIELAHLRGETYVLPEYRREYAGLLTCLSRQEHPDLAAYNDPEVVWRVPKAYHAGLLIASWNQERIEQLIASYAGRFAQDFLTSAPPKTSARTTI